MPGILRRVCESWRRRSPELPRLRVKGGEEVPVHRNAPQGNPALGDGLQSGAGAHGASASNVRRSVATQASAEGSGGTAAG